MFKRSKQGAVSVIDGNCPLSDAHVHELSDLFETVLKEGQPHVVLDMAGIPLCDSEGLELLWSTQENYESRGGQLKLAGLNPLCDEILKITAVAREFEIFPNVATAVGSFVA